jgi:hypothetical protein
MDLLTLQQMLLRFSCLLREVVTEFVDWLANSFPPWAAYQALMAGRLVALNECPGVHPLEIGETWCHLCAKLVLLACGSDAKEQCGINQLCAGLEAGIKEGIGCRLQALVPMQGGRKMGVSSH